jgi:protein AaeX
MYREVAVLGAYFPALVPLCIGGAALTWLVDRLLGRVGLYRFVWHPALFRASLLACICGALGLAIYR